MDKFLGIGFFHVRLTTSKTLEEVEAFVKLHSSRYLISHEITHYHCLCYLEGDPTKKNSSFRSSLKDVLSMEGNKCYSISNCRNVKSLMKYTLKDSGQFVYSGFDSRQIDQMKKCSYQKGKDKFSSELSELEDQFMTSSLMDISDFANKFIKLKISYNHNLYSSHITAYLRKMKIRKHGQVAISEYVEDLLRFL